MKGRLFAGFTLAALIGGALAAPAADVASIYDTLALMNQHSVLYVAVSEAKEVAVLKGEGPYTLFAPTDAAFGELDAATVRAIATNKKTVKRLLNAHLVKGRLTTADLKKLDGQEVKTLQGGSLKVEVTKDGVRVGGVKVVATDIRSSNGVIHVVEKVLPVAK